MHCYSYRSSSSPESVLNLVHAQNLSWKTTVCCSYCFHSLFSTLSCLCHSAACKRFMEEQIIYADRFLCYCSLSGSIGRAQIQIKVIYSFFIFPSTWLCYICNILMWLCLCGYTRGHWAPADILSQAASKTTPTMCELTYTIQHTAMYNSAIISKYKPEQLILVIEREILLRSVQ